jgi:serine protease AprX
VPASQTCPLCDNPIDPAVRQLYREPEKFVVRQLQRISPEWQPAHGACPQCIFQAVQQAQAASSHESLQQQLRLPFPAYPPDHVGILPTPMRVTINPKYTGQGVTLAFLDSGFYPHPDLTRPANRIIAYCDATAHFPEERASFGKIQATSWHGLMTSCVAAGNGFMSEGRFKGIAHRARLVLVKAGNRRSRHITERDIGRALKWVMANRERFGIRVVNISLGGDHPSTGKLTDVDEKVEEAVANGLTVVCAAGNTGTARLVPPASAPSAITVGGVDDQNSLDRARRRMYWSSYGQGAYGVCKPDVLAPALWLAAPMLPKTSTHNEAMYLWMLEALPDKELERQLGTREAERRFSKKTLSLSLPEIRAIIRERIIEQKFIHPHYQHVDGTSMAAPIVSAIVAQMLEANPALTPTQVKALLTATAEPLPDVPAEKQGHGLVNGARAVAAALRLAAEHDPTPVSPQRTITFHYYDRDARQVAIVGSFNNWLPYGYEMQEVAPGAWRLTVPAFERGLHAYKFLLDRTRWAADPENPARVEDGQGAFYSVIELT